VPREDKSETIREKTENVKGGLKGRRQAQRLKKCDPKEGASGKTLQGDKNRRGDKGFYKLVVAQKEKASQPKRKER